MNYYTDKEFFEGKRPWSRIKDQILGSYLSAYLPKVGKLGKKIILVDAFAGPGKFNDGSIGSPMIICQLAEKYVANNYLAIFGNINVDHHKSLEHLLSKNTYKKNALALNLDSSDLLENVQSLLTNETILIYLDPFGIKGCEFKKLVPFLNRTKEFSTEIIMNLNVPVMHRLASKSSFGKGTELDSKLAANQKILTDVLGGDYWKGYLFDEILPPDIQIAKVMSHYRDILQKYLPIVGYCPVYETTPSSQVKYYIFFVSRHIDSALLMNDIMFSAFWKHIWNYTVKGTLFENQPVEEILSRDYYSSLQQIITQSLKIKSQTRIRLWESIVRERFMSYKSSDFKNEIKSLYKTGKIKFRDSRGTGRINDDSIFYLAQ